MILLRFVEFPDSVAAMRAEASLLFRMDCIAKNKLVVLAVACLRHRTEELRSGKRVADGVGIEVNMQL